MTNDDMALVRDYAAGQSEHAFATLVARYIDLVYSTALRQVREPHLAEEITQAVFIILARKAGILGADTILPSWLYRTTGFVAADALKAKHRRLQREQEAYMQSTLNEPEDESWRQIAPLLDAAIAGLGAKDRHAVVLRFFQNKSLNEIGVALGVTEEAAKKRVHRALEKLRRFFTKRGVDSTAETIAETIAAHSVQAAPVALAKTISAVALTKGAAASASTSTLIKGALKIMAWSNAKTAIFAGAVALLVAGTATVVVEGYKEHNKRGADSWEIPTVYDPQHGKVEFDLSTPQVRIKKSIYTNFYAGFWSGTSNKEFRVRISRFPDGSVKTNYLILTNHSDFQSIGLGVTLENIVLRAYYAQPWQVVLHANLPQKPLYDYVSDLPHGTELPLQQLVEKQFGIVGKWETRETDVLLLKLSDRNVGALKPAGDLADSMNITDLGAFDRWHGASQGDAHFYFTMDGLVKELWLQDTFPMPIIDETGLTNQFDFVFKNPTWNYDKGPYQQAEKQAWKDALLNQLGLELVPARRPVEMLVVEKVK